MSIKLKNCNVLKFFRKSFYRSDAYSMVPSYYHREFFVRQEMKCFFIYCFYKFFRGAILNYWINGMDALLVSFGACFNIIEFKVYRCLHDRIRPLIGTFHPGTGRIIWHGNNDNAGSGIIINYFGASEIHFR